jgi:hypothetical protein
MRLHLYSAKLIYQEGASWSDQEKLLAARPLAAVDNLLESIIADMSNPLDSVLLREARI